MPSARPAAATGRACRDAAGEPLADLIARIAATRVLMEHQVWDAVRVLDDGGFLSRDLRHCDAFRLLMDQGRLTGAVQVIARECRFDAAGTVRGRGGRPAGARHGDVAAACLLDSLRDAERACRMRAAFPRTIQEK